MSERDFFSSDMPPPQPVPRAGLGIARELENSVDESTQADVATVPELAPLVASRPLDEFDIENERTRNGRYSHNSESVDCSAAAQDLFSHLAELRARILYSIAAVALASLLTWHYGKDIQEFLAKPILNTLKSSGVKGQLITIEPMEAFYLYFQISLAAAVILAAPFILFQVWRFIEPALTNNERRFTIVLVPFSVILFFSGVVLGYVLSPLFFKFFLDFQPPETVANYSYGSSVALLAKMLIAFGVCFQVPVVTIFLNKIGLVSRNLLIEYWRHAVVLIFVVVAVVTPTWDPVSLTACAVPPCILYLLSIWMVKWL